MPYDTNGDKWACESCVRGHRSSGCNHFKRVLVKVRKPGRPLQQCAHADPESCMCTTQRVLVARIANDGSGCGDRVEVTHVVQPDGTSISVSQLHAQRAMARQHRLQGTPQGAQPMLHHQPYIVYGPHPMPHMMGAISVPAQEQMPHVVYGPHMPSAPHSTGYSVQHGTFIMPPQSSQPHHFQPMMQQQAHPPAAVPVTAGDSGFAAQPQPQPFTNSHSTPVPMKTSDDPSTQYVGTHRATLDSSNMFAPFEQPFEESFGDSQMNTETSSSQALTESDLTSQSSENCFCGDGCTCFGCLSHPINLGSASRMSELADILHQQGSPDQCGCSTPTEGQTPPQSPKLPPQDNTTAEAQPSHMTSISNGDITYLYWMSGASPWTDSNFTDSHPGPAGMNFDSADPSFTSNSLYGGVEEPFL